MNERRGNLAARLNKECACRLTDVSLRARVDTHAANESGSTSILASHPHLFSELAVFLDPSDANEMAGIVAAVDTVVRLRGYRGTVLDKAPSVARIDSRHLGAFMGFDFHIAADGPRLIEINTNAGGAFLNIAARAAQRPCCDSASDWLDAMPSAVELENRIMAMLEHEWALARGGRPLRTIALVDDAPAQQFLYPEFLLAQRLFESRGIQAFIADPADLRIDGDAVRIGAQAIDVVYNRLTDFYLEDPRHQVLRTAHERDLVVLTPHPRAHALYADKRNLELLSDARTLERIGAAPEAARVLQRGIPQTRRVDGCDATWWNERKQWFFKPNSGFGSRGAYRGDKLTRRVFAEIMEGQYVAQKLTPPAERSRRTAGAVESFKFDVRCYAYAGEIQLMAARLYQGQTTNFRTTGGGFSQVYVTTPR